MTDCERKLLEDAEPAPSGSGRAHPEGVSWVDWPEGRDSYVSETGKPTSKWRGRSILQIRQRQEEVQQAQMGMMALRRAATAANDAVLAEVQGLLGVKVWLGHHPCPSSPALQCVFLASDEDGDVCLFCEEPNERG